MNFKDSFKKNYRGMLLMLIAACCTSTGQLFWKLSNNKVDMFLIGGFTLYGLGAILMITAFRYGSLSVLHPMLCLSYIIALFLGYFFLGEFVRIEQLIGISLIIAGVIFIGGGDE